MPTVAEQRSRREALLAETPGAETAGWGTPAPLALGAFAVTTFMLSTINAGWVDESVKPVVYGVALMFGGVTQLAAALICFRVGNLFAGVLFGGFGAFWLSLFAIVQFFIADIPEAERGHALGLFLYSFGFFAVWMFVASFRTNVVVVVALAFVIATFFTLGAGDYGGNADLVKIGGYLGVLAAALAAYLSCAEVCEATYGREVLPVGHLGGPHAAPAGARNVTPPPGGVE